MHLTPIRPIPDVPGGNEQDEKPEYVDPENIFGLASIQQSIDYDRKNRRR
jgi:hypothetical protein